jgi:hypothetical protein
LIARSLARATIPTATRGDRAPATGKGGRRPPRIDGAQVEKLQALLGGHAGGRLGFSFADPPFSRGSFFASPGRRAWLLRFASPASAIRPSRAAEYAPLYAHHQAVIQASGGTELFLNQQATRLLLSIFAGSIQSSTYFTLVTVAGSQPAAPIVQRHRDRAHTMRSGSVAVLHVALRRRPPCQRFLHSFGLTHALRRRAASARRWPRCTRLGSPTSSASARP